MKNDYKPDLPDLRGRVLQFNTLQLPGQPMSMHMGTGYLVSDLLRALEYFAARRLPEEGTALLSEVLNAGDDDSVWVNNWQDIRRRIRNYLLAQREPQKEQGS